GPDSRDSSGPANRDGGVPACRWEVDEIEVRRDGPSYTLDTLAELRRRLGAEPALILILGSDQLRNLATWHRWQELLDFAHIAVTQREQVSLADLPPPVDALLARHGADALPDTPGGAIVLFRMPAVAVSATGLRRALANGSPVDRLLPAAVADYARSHDLYAGLRDDSR
ncbi:MAG: nicotinate-nicotinamide nucleotide adenylyltransferase, partial [Lautropia sp.]